MSHQPPPELKDVCAAWERLAAQQMTVIDRLNCEILILKRQLADRAVKQ